MEGGRGISVVLLVWGYSSGIEKVEGGVGVGSVWRERVG